MRFDICATDNWEVLLSSWNLLENHWGKNATFNRNIWRLKWNMIFCELFSQCQEGLLDSNLDYSSIVPSTALPPLTNTTILLDVSRCDDYFSLVGQNGVDLIPPNAVRYNGLWLSRVGDSCWGFKHFYFAIYTATPQATMFVSNKCFCVFNLEQSNTMWYWNTDYSL